MWGENLMAENKRLFVSVRLGAGAGAGCQYERDTKPRLSEERRGKI